MKKNIFVSISLISALVLALPISAFASSSIGTSVGSSQVCTSNSEGISSGTDTGHSDGQSNVISSGNGWSKGSGTSDAVSTNTGISGDTQSNSTSIGEGWSKGSSTSTGVGTTDAGQSHSTSTSDTQSNGTSTTDATITHGESIGTSNSHTDNCGQTYAHGSSNAILVSEKGCSYSYDPSLKYFGIDKQNTCNVVIMGINKTSVISSDGATEIEASPYIKNGSTLVPVRSVSESLKSKVDWDSKTKIITITNGDIIIKLTVGSLKATINGQDVTLLSAPETKNGRTFVPLRFICENLKAKVSWNAEDQLITITK
jgi:hypothetical protein